MRQWPSAALLTADPFIPAQNTTTCTMQPPGKAAAASVRVGAVEGLRQGRWRHSGSGRAIAGEPVRKLEAHHCSA